MRGCAVWCLCLVATANSLAPHRASPRLAFSHPRTWRPTHSRDRIRLSTRAYQGERDSDGSELLVDIKEQESALRTQLEALQKRKVAVLARKRMRIGIVGFGNFGQFLAKAFEPSHDIYAISRSDYSAAGRELNLAGYYTLDQADEFFGNKLDVVVFAVCWCVCAEADTSPLRSGGGRDLYAILAASACDMTACLCTAVHRFIVHCPLSIVRYQSFRSSRQCEH